MRNSPSQKRSADKVDSILAAAEELILEHHIEDVTTKMIAERAGVTRTSMYHFFPSKIDVMDALSERYHDQLRQRIYLFFNPEKREDYHRAWIGVSDVYKQFFEESPAAAVLLLGANGAKQALFGDEASEERLANDVGQLMTRHTNLWDLAKGPPPEPDFFQFVLRMMTSLFSAGIRKEGKISEKTEKAVQKATIAYLDSAISEK